jgi:hypothetical protein
MALATLDEVKTALGVTGPGDDVLLEQLRAAAEGFVEQHCGRAFAGGSFTEYLPGGGRMAFLRNFPVDSVASVYVDARRVFDPPTLRAADTYHVHAARGVVESLDGPFVPPRPDRAGRSDLFPGAVKVTYSAPAAVPAAVRKAYTDLIGHWFHQVKTHVATGQVNVLQTTSGTTVTAYPWGQAGGFSLPAGVLQLLKAYRVPAV